MGSLTASVSERGSIIGVAAPPGDPRRSKISNPSIVVTAGTAWKDRRHVARTREVRRVEEEFRRLMVDIRDVVSELRDFADKLGRAARLDFGDLEKLDSAVTYDPDLNDGVVLNIAPLHELVPWKEAKAYWDELMKGEYEWSSMGNRLRAKGLVS
jgi:hypothetical protein